MCDVNCEFWDRKKICQLDGKPCSGDFCHFLQIERPKENVPFIESLARKVPTEELKEGNEKLKAAVV